jgi:uncharacterized cysteine cluster protein YcgN (CxxCxxCC family)
MNLTCKCGYNPSQDIQKFKLIFWELGSMDKITQSYHEAICSECGEKFMSYVIKEKDSENESR